MTPPPSAKLHIAEQTIPGEYVRFDEEEAERRGLPDMVIHDGMGWAVIFEAKYGSSLSADQLRRHQRTAARYGIDKSEIVALVIERTGKELDGVHIHEWRELYMWLGTFASNSYYARELAAYFRVLERRMIADEYQKKGTLTMFDGLRFDDDEPYTYAEAKRRLRLLGDVLHKRKDLIDLGMDPKGLRRKAITGRDGSRVWDYLPLRAARGSNNFTAFPHLTLALHDDEAIAGVTVPNSVRGGFKTRLKAIGYDGFVDLLLDIEDRLQEVVQQSKDARPRIYAIQRRYASQRATPQTNARLEADLRTLVPGGRDGVKHQPQWIEAIYLLLTEKRSNIQFGVTAAFDYSCPIVRSPEVANLYARAWIGCRPMLEFVLGD